MKGEVSEAGVIRTVQEDILEGTGLGLAGEYTVWVSSPRQYPEELFPLRITAATWRRFGQVHPDERQRNCLLHGRGPIKLNEYSQIERADKQNASTTPTNRRLLVSRLIRQERRLYEYLPQNVQYSLWYLQDAQGSKSSRSGGSAAQETQCGTCSAKRWQQAESGMGHQGSWTIPTPRQEVVCELALPQ